MASSKDFEKIWENYQEVVKTKDVLIILLVRNRKRRLLDTIKWRKVKSDILFQKIILAELPVKSGLRSYGGLRIAHSYTPPFNVMIWTENSPRIL